MPGDHLAWGSLNMIEQSYLLHRRPSPTATKRMFDQTVLPRAIDAAANVEAALRQVTQLVRGQPALTLGVAAGVGFLAGMCASLGRRRTRSRS
jgi:hypothetical protein